MTELASDTTVVIVFSAVMTAAIALTTLLACVVFFWTFDRSEDQVGDVQRFLDLTAEARSLLGNGPVLSDPHGETSAAIERFKAKKEEARRALWQSRASRADERPAESRRDGIAPRADLPDRTSAAA